MRIQNNITAMNTHRQYTINNDNVAKSAEKLSSGYRINRAGDDAAGLAISEKMRSQIRGLNMATKNSQDAISLVQTAEGALQETHAMLQRMNELAVQAATGTNEELDRSALAKEFEQLKREINDVAEQTNFNNMKILDGSLSYAGFVRSAATSGITTSVSTLSDIGAIDLKQEVTTDGKDLKPAQPAKEAEILLKDAALNEKSVADQKYELTLKDATSNQEIKISFTGDGEKSILEAATAAAATVADGYKVSASDGGLVVKATEAGAKGIGATMSASLSKVSDSAAATVTSVNGDDTAAAAKWTFTKPTSGTEANIFAQGADGQSFKVTVELSDGTSKDITVDLDSTNSTLGDALNGKTIQVGKHTYEFGYDSGNLTLEDTDAHANTESIKSITVAQQVTAGNPTALSSVAANATTATSVDIATAASAGLDKAPDAGTYDVTIGGVTFKGVTADGTDKLSDILASATGTLADGTEVTVEKVSDTKITLTAHDGRNMTAVVKASDKINLSVASMTLGADTPITAEGKDGAKFTATVATNASGADLGTKPESGTQIMTITVGTTAYTVESDEADGAKTLAQLFDGKTVTIGDNSYTLKEASGSIKITADKPGTASNITIGSVKIGASADTTDLRAAVAVDGKNEVEAVELQKEVNSVSFDYDKLQDGDKITINGKVYTVGDGKDQVSRGANKAAFVNNLSTAVADNDGQVIVRSTSTGFDVEQTTRGSGDDEKRVGSTSVFFAAGTGKSSQTTIEIDAVKLKAGDEVNIKIDDQEFKYTVKEGDNAKDIIAGLNLDENYGKAKGNAIIVDGRNVDVESGFKARPEDPNSYNAIRIQVGALENEQLAVSIDSMNTAGLGLDGQNLDTQDSAGSAITAVRSAINKVSDQRATLGAMQNRLDHKIANLKVASENLSASESRIRDVDMAQEMTNFTKNNILSQAATAMLAQANSLPQNVLSLLG